MQSAILTGHEVTGYQHRIRDKRLEQEGSQWNGSGAITLKDADSYLQADLRSPQEISALLIQADNNDQYVVEGSLDGKTFTNIWVAGAPEEAGLRTRVAVMSKRSKARYLRIKGQGGDGFYSLSEVRVYCKAPKPFPPKLNLPPKKHFWAMLTNPLMVHVQAALATFATILLLGFMVRYPFKRKLKPHRLRDSLLALGALGGLGYWTYSGEVRDAAIGGGFLLAFLLVRWASGDAVYSRKLAPIARAMCKPPYALLLSGLLLAAIAACFKKFGVVAGAGAIFVSVFFWSLTRMLRAPVSFRQTARLLLLPLGFCGFASWWNVGHFHFDHYIHIWEQYHYFIGAKYGPELRYGLLYDCTTAADLANGQKKGLEKRKVRKLATDNELGDTKAIMDNPKLCTDHFSKKRFEDFRKDIRFLRSRFSPDRWDKSQTDHGYNATPVWGIVARAVVDRVGDLNWKKIEYLGSIDTVLLILMWIFAYWAFGFEPVMVALICWGFNYPGRFYWNGGGLLRYDWLLWLVVGLGFLRKKQNFLGGVFLTYTTLLRIFPGFVVAALVLKALYRMLRERRFVLSREHTAFAAGCVITIAVLIPASSWSMGGLDAWPQFVRNSQKHIETALTNNMGLKTVLGYDFGTRAAVIQDNKAEDPYKGWKDARKYFYHKRTPIFLTLIALFCLLLAKAGDRSEDWETACMGVGLIVIASELTCYYYAFMLAYGLMWDRRKLPGMLAAAWSATTAFSDRLPWNDDRYTLMSLLCVLMVVAVTAHAAFEKKSTSTAETPA